MESFDLSLVDWSRAQFALTAIYHWFFVPLTLGISFIIAIMHTIYYKTGDEQWGKMVKFWMKLFGINFAIGVATGIILEFEFGTNWSNYSWFVGDIFGAPLAVEGIFAFFLESTFIAVMFFGWNRISKKFHMISSWMVAFGSNLSALWILVANAWMQDPVGIEFNMDTGRNEMVNFWEVLFSPTAISKFLHTITSSYMVAATFVIGVSSWYLLKNRHIKFAKRSIVIASIFGLVSSITMAVTGDQSAYQVGQKQPMKMAAMEGLYHGETNANLLVFGIYTPTKLNKDENDKFYFPLEIPVLSYMVNRDFDSFVPGIYDLLDGNKEQGIPSTEERMANGKKALAALKAYKQAKKEKNLVEAENQRKIFKANYKDLGYGFIKDKKETVPSIGTTFYSFHFMVAIGLFLIYYFFIMLRFGLKDKYEKKRFWLKVGVWSYLIAMIASQLGWALAEVGRQPWTIQNLLPTSVSTSHLSVSSVQTTFWLFAILFTILLIVEIKIMIKQIKLGPKE